MYEYGKKQAGLLEGGAILVNCQIRLEFGKVQKTTVKMYSFFEEFVKFICTHGQEKIKNMQLLKYTMFALHLSNGSYLEKNSKYL